MKQNDKLRQMQIEQEGITVLRFSNEEMKLKPEEVIQRLEIFLTGKRASK
jgi:very-short-patch-repair endonuclease